MSEQASESAQTNSNADEGGVTKEGFEEIFKSMVDNEKSVDSEEKPIDNEGVSGESEVKDDKEASESTEKRPLNSLNDLAELLEVENKDLYQVKIPMADGEELTLGEIKDLAASSKDLDVRSVKFEAERIAASNKIQKDHSELMSMASMLPKEALNPKLIEKWRGLRDDHIAEEEGRLLEVMPSWKDENVKASEVSAINEHLKEYGLGENLLDQLTDHRMKRYLRESWKLAESVKKALEASKQREPSKPSAPAKHAPNTGRKINTNSKMNGRSKINELFKGM